MTPIQSAASLRRPALFLAALLFAMGLALPRHAPRPRDRAEAGCRLRGFDDPTLLCYDDIPPPNSVNIVGVLRWGASNGPATVTVTLNCIPDSDKTILIYYRNETELITPSPDYLLPYNDNKETIWPYEITFHPGQFAASFGVHLNPKYTASTPPLYPASAVKGVVFATEDNVKPSDNPNICASGDIAIAPPASGQPSVVGEERIKGGGEIIPVSLSAEAPLIARESQEAVVRADSFLIAPPGSSGDTITLTVLNSGGKRDQIMIACAKERRDYFRVITPNGKKHCLPYALPLNKYSRYTKFTIRLVKPYNQAKHNVLFYSYFRSHGDPPIPPKVGAIVSVH